MNKSVEMTATQEEAVVWAFFHDLFRVPTLDQWEWLQSGTVSQAWAILSKEYAEDLPEELPLPDSHEQFHEEYLEAFEVGAPSPPCPLIESHWNKRDSTPRILHENMMFYRQFGLDLRSSANETADHLRHQFEFVHYLCLLVDRYTDDDDEHEFVEQLGQAKSDFIERHLLSWIPKAAESFNNECSDWWPSHWMVLLNSFLASQKKVTQIA